MRFNLRAATMTPQPVDSQIAGHLSRRAILEEFTDESMDE